MGEWIGQPYWKWKPKGRSVIRRQADETKDLGTLQVPAGSIGT